MSSHLLKSYTYRKTLISYTVILIIPTIVFCSIFIKETLQNNKREMVQMYEQDTQRIRDTIDSKLAELNSMGDRLYQSNWVGKLTSDTKIFEKEFDTLKKLEIIQDLNNYMAFSRILSSIAVIF